MWKLRMREEGSMSSTEAPPIIYNLFPRLAGPFMDWGAHLERAAAMGFNWVFINPIQDCGYSGSMYAIKDHYKIDRRYLDPSSGLSAEEQFKAVLARAHGLGLRVMLDVVINHTAFDSVLADAHPDWYKRDSQGSLMHPGAPDTGTVWGDLATIDNEHAGDRENLWRYWGDLIAYYLSLGLDGFRCDAAYQVPIPLWQRVMQRGRSVNPAAKFFAETLGCDPRLCIELAQAGFDYNFNSSKWWNFRDSWALEQYEQNRQRGSPSISFPDSHDTTRLAADLNGNLPGIKLRYLFAATFSAGVMMVAGYEFCFQRRLDVVETRPEDWEPAQCDLTEFIRATNALKAGLQVFREESRIDVLASPNSQIFAMRKTSADERQRALVILNTNLNEQQYFRIDGLQELLGYPREIRDLSTENRLDTIHGFYEAHLQPAQVVILWGER
jgi:starch synthase (maltosyl-transferring)